MTALTGAYRQALRNISCGRTNAVFQFEISPRHKLHLNVRYNGGHIFNFFQPRQRGLDAVSLLGFAGGLTCEQSFEIQIVVRIWPKFEHEKTFQQIARSQSRLKRSKAIWLVDKICGCNQLVRKTVAEMSLHSQSYQDISWRLCCKLKPGNKYLPKSKTKKTALK